MRFPAAVALLVSLVPPLAADVTGCRREGNRFLFELTDGSAEIEWVSPSAFRVSRLWTGPAAVRTAFSDQPLNVAFTEAPDAFEFRTRYVTLRLGRKDALLSAETREGKPLFRDLAVTRSVDGVRVEKALTPDEHFFGLGPRESEKFDLRGTQLRAGKAFLISTAGYGEYYRVPASYRFDLGAGQPDRRSVMLSGAHRLEYFVYYGPEPKQILEEHLPFGGTIDDPEPAQFSVMDSRKLPLSTTVLAVDREGTWESLREYVRMLGHASLSAVLLPDFDLTPYLKAPTPVRARAEQLAGVMPLVHASSPGELTPALTNFRRLLLPIFTSYAHEARDRGMPLIHPMPMQFPKDPAAMDLTDQFMVGDELLAAPILGPAPRRSVYLPMGQWTEWRTDKAIKGRQTIEIEAGDELPLFVKSGSIVPLAPSAVGRPVELHYYPNIGGEFFFYERGSIGYSQMHAGPAGDVLRLEIEALADRSYEWIVHHAAPCKEIKAGDRTLATVGSIAALAPGTWFYDLRGQSLHVRVDVRAGEDLILNIAN